MKSICLTILLAMTSCALAQDDSIHASAFRYDPNAAPVTASAFIYDPDAPVIYASGFFVKPE